MGIKKTETTANGKTKIFYDSGLVEYFFDGVYHREDGPAVIYPNGQKEWWYKGKYHREDGPAVIMPNGFRGWYIHGKIHREDGPALIFPNGHKEWRFENKKHRTDGPAVIHSDGTKEWWIDGYRIESGTVVSISISILERMGAWELFTPKELLIFKSFHERQERALKELIEFIKRNGTKKNKIH